MNGRTEVGMKGWHVARLRADAIPEGEASRVVGPEERFCARGVRSGARVRFAAKGEHARPTAAAYRKACARACGGERRERTPSPV